MTWLNYLDQIDSLTISPPACALLVGCGLAVILWGMWR